MSPSRLHAADLRVGYDDRVIIEDLSVEIPDGSFTVIVGPNASGKSTLLRALSRLLRPTHGAVLLDGHDVREMGGKEFARELGLLPQESIAPEGITVVDLVARGRFPYQRLFRQWSDEDERAVREALEATQLLELSTRPVEALSGGQRQRVWIAMALAQETPILLLDEPTTYLDLAHQLEVLELCTRLHRQGRTLVAVLHDLNQAARYASHLVAMSSGAVAAQGTPSEVVTEEVVHRVFGVRARVIDDPETRTPMVIPLASGAVSAADLPGDTAIAHDPSHP
ncbi:ABC transporter ATP-binding protein [Janibacter sp. CX7]|uniref:ABC transporter ATP-binding protein n=1 Tax=Janibacter sp. CX7 TaxID=2963431 RepID=UPI0020CC2419|nr:ABC transporter ATP-binding protein [Janibacter sp. CX7]UTT67597.1 ABC transporter ATP-binding protein [Janibacter sp. CX7]